MAVDECAVTVCCYLLAVRSILWVVIVIIRSLTSEMLQLMYFIIMLRLYGKLK